MSVRLVAILLVATATQICAHELSELHDAIEKRTRSYSMVDITWTITSEYAEALNQSENYSDPFGTSGPKVAFNGQLPVTFKWQARFRCSGSKVRLDFISPNWSFGEEKFNFPINSFLFDGIEGRTLATYTDSPFPNRGTVARPPLPWGQRPEFIPMIWHFRGFDYPGNFDRVFFADDTVVARERSDDGESLVLTRRNIGSAVCSILHVDASYPHVIKQCSHSEDGQIRYETRVSGFQALGDSVVPQRWSVKSIDPTRSFRISSKAVVVRALINRPVDESVFSLPFPSGSLVSDHRGDYRKRFILIGDGEREFEVSQRQVRDAVSAQQLLQLVEGNSNRASAVR